MKIGSSFVISVSWEDYDDEIGGIVTLRRRSDRDYEGKRFFGHQSFGSNWFFWIGKALGVFEEGFPRLMVMELGRLDRLVNQRYQGSYKEGVVLAIIQTLLNYCSRYAFSDLEKRINVGQYLDFYWICSFGLIIVVSMEPPLMERYGSVVGKVWWQEGSDSKFGIEDIDSKDQGPPMLSYKGAVESQGREVGVVVDGNNRRSGQQVMRNRDYKGKGIAYDSNNYEGSKKPGFKRSYGDQDVAYSRNMRPSGRLLHAEAPVRQAMATNGLSKLVSQDVGQHLDDQQKLMLDAFRSGKSGEKSQFSGSTARKALTFEGNPSEMATLGLEEAEDVTMEEAETKDLEEIPLLSDHLDAAAAEEKTLVNKEEWEGVEEGEKEIMIEGVGTERLTEDVVFTEITVESGAAQLEDVILTEADTVVGEEGQLLETETQEVTNVNEGKECQANKKKLGKAIDSVMGGTLKKRLVQSVVSPRKKHTANQGGKMGEKGALPPKSASVRPDPAQD
ncbi:hypothetical protein IGI04_039660 [Brassica rapa subsp. trilocularis]|uniref:Aminotransferase-like plant mobile domain-containing protein n=1 Tax=Brassica rapa subsp. trilocularis TaxID=1813537 RepID=A0ABQ7KLG2_BRACM|nr:hypothetical protein IGI04_039660 [Brassica rapa subsp. trilocularis]